MHPEPWRDVPTGARSSRPVSVGVPRRLLCALLASLLCVVGQAAEVPSAGTHVRVGVYENPPKVFQTAHGEYAGIFPDLLARVAARERWILDYAPGEWTECLDRLKKGKIDIMVDVAVSPDRAKHFAFSNQTVLVNWGALYARPGSSLSSLLDLKGQTLATMRGSIHTGGEGGIRAVLQKLDVSCTIIEVDSYDAVFEKLRSGAADVGAVNRLFGAANAARYGVTETPFIFNPNQLRYAFPKSGRFGDALRMAIDANLAAMKAAPDAPIQQIVADYLSRPPEEWGTRPGPVEEKPATFSLSVGERAWVAAHPMVRIGVDQNWLPFEALDPRKGHLGIASDYSHLVAERLGVTLQPMEGLSWKQTLQAAKNRQLDLLPALSSTPERAKYLAFSEPYVSFPVVLVTRKAATPAVDLAGLGERRVALVDGYSIQEYLRRDFPRITQVPVTDIDSGLRAVAEGQVDAYADNLAAVTHALERLELGSLSIASTTPYTVDLRFGVRSDWPELVPILNKVLATITPRRRTEINDYWITQRPSEERKLRRIRTQVLWATVCLAAVGAGFFFHNQRLRAQIRERERLSRELERAKNDTDLANERLKELDRLKSMFIASMSHELRTPLNSIIGFTGVILKGLAGPLNEEQRDQLERVFRSGKHLLALITDVIDIAKIESGKIVPYAESFALEDVVREACDAVRKEATEKGLAVRAEQPGETVTLHTDRRRFFQCVLNLLSNAVKFTEAGSVTVATATPGAGWAEVSVADTGIGIAPEDLARLFGSFVRLDSPLKTVVPGTGLGLYLTRKLIQEVLGGDITVESTPGKGTRFTLRVPRELPSPPESVT